MFCRRLPVGPRIDCLVVRPEDELVVTLTEEEEDEVVLCSLELGSQPSTINKEKRRRKKRWLLSMSLKKLVVVEQGIFLQS